MSCYDHSYRRVLRPLAAMAAPRAALGIALLAQGAAAAPRLFAAPPGCSWLASRPGGNGESGPCGADTVGPCGPGLDFVSTHSLACSPPPGVAVRPELLVFTPGAGPANYSLLLSTAASWGFRGLAINFVRHQPACQRLRL